MAQTTENLVAMLDAANLRIMQVLTDGGVVSQSLLDLRDRLRRDIAAMQPDEVLVFEDPRMPGPYE